MQAMIFAAGLGTRLRPLTNDRPKAMVEINGKPLLEHLIHKLIASGVDHIVINTHHFANQITDFVNNNDFGIRIDISHETELLDTGGGIKHALPYFSPDEPILVHNTDIVSTLNLRNIWQQHISSAHPIGATLGVNERDTSRYLLFDTRQNLCGWTNIQTRQVRTPLYADCRPIDTEQARAVLNPEACRRQAFSGIHIISPELFHELAHYPQTVFSIIDFYLSVCNRIALKPYLIPADCAWVDCGKPDSLNIAAQILTLQNRE